MSRDSGRVGKPTGLSSATEPASSLGPTGFDPSRWYPMQRVFAKAVADEIVADAGAFGLGGAALHAGAMAAAARLWLRTKELRDSDGSPEGRDAEERLGAEHDSAGPKGIAQTPSEPNP